MGPHAHTRIARKLREVEKERQRLEKALRRRAYAPEDSPPFATLERRPSPALAGGQPQHTQPTRPHEPERLDKERFANYFSSGNFLPGPRPMPRRERRQQRYRAILVLLAVLIFGFILIRVLWP